MNQIEIFYDGASVRKWSAFPVIKGFTTNCSILSQHTTPNYKVFYNSIKDSLAGRAFSFQTWEEEDTALIAQIQEIHSIDSSIYVKIPIIRRNGDYNATALRYVHKHSIPVNVTAIYTLDQIDQAYEILHGIMAPIIISIFGGSISDIGVDPAPYITYAINRFRSMPNARILWASCREAYTIERAQAIGCHIITVPDDILEKYMKHDTLVEMSKARVTKFYSDAVKGGLTIL